jgi:hypothetical protein
MQIRRSERQELIQISIMIGFRYLGMRLICQFLSSRTPPIP